MEKKEADQPKKSPMSDPLRKVAVEAYRKWKTRMQNLPKEGIKLCPICKAIVVPDNKPCAVCLDKKNPRVRVPEKEKKRTW